MYAAVWLQFYALMLRHSDSCIQSSDSCIQSSDSCLQSSHSCIQSSDSCIQSSDSCIQSSHSCIQSSDSCLQSSHSCIQSSDSCIQSSDSCIQSSDSCIQSSDSCIQSSGIDDHSCINWGDYGYGFIGHLFHCKGWVGGDHILAADWVWALEWTSGFRERGLGVVVVVVGGGGSSLSFWARIQVWGSWGNRSTQPVGILAQLWGGGGGTHSQLCELCQWCQWSPPHPTHFFLSFNCKYLSSPKLNPDWLPLCQCANHYPISNHQEGLHLLLHSGQNTGWVTDKGILYHFVCQEKN